MRAEEIRGLHLFDGVSDAQLAQLVDAGTEVPVEVGVVAFTEGEYADHWWLLVEGALDLFRRLGGEETRVAKMDTPGQWSGGFRAWDEHGTYLATGKGVVPGRLLQVPASVLRDLFNSWFPFGNHLIAGIHQTARSIESTARQRGALVTLGTLAAGLAHEINNPASAASRSVAALDEECTIMLGALGRLATQRISAAQFVELDKLRLELDPARADQDALARADREQELLGWLAQHGVERDWAVATRLAEAGVDVGWCDRVAGVLADSTGAAEDAADADGLGGSAGSALEFGLEWVASTVAAASLVREVKESTRRISELVAAVRSYSQMDRGSLQSTEVTEGLESTLVMLGHKLRDGVSVVREYDAELPRIDAYAGELNQVWTNLIDNAVDAMDGAGTLKVATRSEDGEVVVEITDSGAGMPPEVMARAFDAFFTTKEVGKGTGLGLDIARRIVVDRHGGRIDVDSEPGQTVMRVTLPARPPR